MDATTINTIVGIVGIICSMVGIVVGIIGWKSLTTTTKIYNKAQANNGSTVQQAQSIYNGLSAPDVVEITDKKIDEKTKLLQDRFSQIKTEIVSPSMSLKRKRQIGSFHI